MMGNAMSELTDRQIHEMNRQSWNAATTAHNIHKRDQVEFLGHVTQVLCRTWIAVWRRRRTKCDVVWVRAHGRGGVSSQALG